MGKEKNTGVYDDWRVPEALWQRVEPLLPAEGSKPKGGRPRVSVRECMDGIFYVQRTLPGKDQWKALPRCLGAASTVHDRFQEWRAAGVFERLWQEGLIEYDTQHGLDWEWQAMLLAMIVVAERSTTDGGPNFVYAHDFKVLGFYTVEAIDVALGELPSEAVCDPGDVVTGGGICWSPGYVRIPAQADGGDRIIWAHDIKQPVCHDVNGKSANFVPGDWPFGGAIGSV